MKLTHKIGGAFFVAALVVVLLSAKLTDQKPVAHVDLLRQNVLYIGVDNPVEIRIDGIAPDKISPTMIGGTLTADSVGSGRFIARVVNGMKATINVSYKNEDGTMVQCGSYSYRNKRIPDPVTYINAISTDGVVLKELLPNITGVFTRMVNFDFNCAFKPVSFSMSVIEDGEWKEYKAEGPVLTAEMKTALTKCEEEDKIIFHSVKTKGPAGDVRHVNGVIITVK